jgi:transposase-like protein
MEKQTCAYCGSAQHTHKDGHNRVGTQRYRCTACARYFTPAPKEQGYGEETRQRAVQLYLEGMSYRGVGRLLGVVHQTVVNWVTAHAATLPEAVAHRLRDENEGHGTVEVDELETYIGGKKRAGERDRGGTSRDAAGGGATGDAPR